MRSCVSFTVLCLSMLSYRERIYIINYVHQLFQFLLHADKQVLLIIKPTRCNNFLNLFLEWNSTCFGQSHCPSSGVFSRYIQQWLCHTGLLTACEQDQDGTAVPSWSCSQAVSKPVWHTCTYNIAVCTVEKTPDDGQWDCPKHIEFHSKNKFEKIVHLVGFSIINVTSRRLVNSYGQSKEHSASSWIFLHKPLDYIPK
jgi:hypothetical protein